jgi:hypothetical protein
MRTDGVVSAKVTCQRCAGFCPIRVGPHVHLLVLDAPPQPLDEHVVDPSTLAVHADSNAGVLEHFDPFLAGELRSLVGVEDLRYAELRDRLLERFDAKVHRQRVGEPEGQDLAASHIQDRDKVQKAVGIGRYVISLADLVGPLDRNAREQIRIDCRPARWDAGAWPSV